MIQEFLLAKPAVFRMERRVNRNDFEHYRTRNVLLSFSPSIATDYFFDFTTLVINLVVLNDATDARDKVYGIVAYLKHNYPDFQLAKVDYTTSLRNVYELFTRSILVATGDLLGSRVHQYSSRR